MRFGVCVMGHIDEIGSFAHAETLGFDSVWVTTVRRCSWTATWCWRSPCCETPAFASVPVPRSAARASCPCTRRRWRRSIAWRLVRAPRYRHGKTAMRMMGQPPMVSLCTTHYLRAPSGLLRGEIVRRHLQRRDPADQDLMHDEDDMNLEPPHPLYVSDSGRGRWSGGRLRGRSRLRHPAARRARRRGARPRASRQGRSAGSRASRTACSPISRSSTRASPPTPSQCLRTPSVRTSWRACSDFDDEAHERGIDPLPFFRPMWARHCALVEAAPARGPGLPT